jgi:hypothetical protein
MQNMMNVYLVSMPYLYKIRIPIDLPSPKIGWSHNSEKPVLRVFILEIIFYILLKNQQANFSHT